MLPGINKPAFAPSFEKFMRDAFAPVGLMIRYWKRTETPGASRTIEVYAMNDKGAPWSGKVTLKITTLNSAIAKSMTGNFPAVPTGNRGSVNYSIDFPATAGHYKLIAEYIENNDTVQSIRDFRIAGADLAVKKPIAASSSLPGFPASNANDDNAATRWSSQSGGPQWIRADLGSGQKIFQVELAWDTVYAKEYRIETSNDDNSWTTVYTRTDGAGGVEILEFSFLSCRYVRMYTTSQNGCSLRDFRVYGAPQVTVSPADGRNAVSAPPAAPKIIAVTGQGKMNIPSGKPDGTGRFALYTLQGRLLRQVRVNGRDVRSGGRFKVPEGIYILREEAP